MNLKQKIRQIKEKFSTNYQTARAVAKMARNKKGAISTGSINSAITFIILIVVLFQLYATLVPTAQTAGDTLNASGVPLGALFAGTGVVFVIIMAALLVSVVRGAMGKTK